MVLVEGYMNHHMACITPGSKVMLHFSISLKDGTMVENSFGDEPSTLVVGEGDFEPGLEQLLYGLYRGQRKRFVITPEQGFGFPDPEAVQSLNKSEFPANIPLEAGLIVEFTTPGGDQIPGTILKIEDDKVEVDFNHPLAGREFLFEVEILEVSCTGNNA